MRLNIGVLRAEQFFSAVDCQLLHDIDIFTAAVVAFARIAFSVLIRQNTALRLHYGTAYNIFRSNHFQFVALSAKFHVDCFLYLRVNIC